MTKLSKENKQVFFLGDFSIDLLNYNDHQPTNEFLDSLASNSFLPYILQPTRLTSHSKTLIDNIFSNVISYEVISGNITATISDHLPQFLFVPNVFSNPSCQKSNIYERDWSKFVQQNFVLDYFDKDWSDVCQLDQQDMNLSINSFLNNMNSILLDEHAPLKRVNKYKLKFKSKPWITPAIQKSISVKNNLLKRFINSKDPQAKDIFHEQYKDYRNMLSTLLKKSKIGYHNQYFEANMNNIKNTWKGIKSILTIKNTSSDFPKCLSSNGSTFTNQVEISNIFNNYFASIAEKVNINYSHKHFFDFLKDKNQNSFFLSPTNKYEIQNVISSLNSNKSVGPNSIPTRILKLLKNDISTQLADIFNISFSTGVFPTILKVAKVVSVHKKESKLDFSNYRPISLLSNIEKILERLMYNRIYKFFSEATLFIHYNLVSDKSIPLFML